MKSARMAAMAAMVALLPWTVLMLAGRGPAKVSPLLKPSSTNWNFALAQSGSVCVKPASPPPVLKPAATAVNVGPYLNLLPSVPAPESTGLPPRGRMGLNALPAAPPLKPGVYQTYLHSIILVAPKRGIDDGCLAGTSGVHSRMPIINPGVSAVPRIRTPD